MSNNLTNT